MGTIISPTKSIVGTSLGTLYVRLTVNPQQLIQGMRGAQNSVKGATSTMSRQLSSFAIAAGSAFAAVAAASAYQFAKFDQAMTQSLAVVGDVTDGTRAKMEELALSMATTSNKSAVDLAKTYYELAQAGFDVEQSMAALPIVTKFATAAIVDNEKATSMLSEAQAALDMKSQDAAESMTNMARISDVLAKASFLTTASIEEIGTALTHRAAPAMRAFGMELEEGVAVLSTFMQRGMSSREAGQALYIVLRDLQRAVIKQPENWKALGVEVYDAEGNMRGMADIVDQLSDALDGASDREKRFAFQLLGFTDKSLAATLALMGAGSQIRTYEKELRNAGGTTKQVSDDILSSFQNQLIQSLHVLQNLAIEIGRELAPAILDLAKEVANFLEGLLAAEKESKAISETLVILANAAKVVGFAISIVWNVLKTLATLISTNVVYVVEMLNESVNISVEMWGIFTNMLMKSVTPALKFVGKTVASLALILKDLFLQNYSAAAEHAKALVMEGAGAAKSIARSVIEETAKADTAIKQSASRMKDITVGMATEAVTDISSQWTGVYEMGKKLFAPAEESAKSAEEGLKDVSTAGVDALKKVETVSKAVTTAANQANAAVRRMVDSAAANELMNLLGIPASTSRRKVTAKELMDSMNVGERGEVDSSEAADMLRRAGFSEEGGTSSIGPGGMLLDPAMSELSGVGTEIKEQEAKLELLKELGDEEILLTEEVQRRKTEAIEAYAKRLSELKQAEFVMVVRAGQDMFDQLTQTAADFAGEQSGIYKAMFAASKAFAIAESIVKIQQGIAGAASLPFPSNLAAMASVVSATASIMSAIQSVKLEFAGEREKGGPVQMGKSYLVGEKGPEMFSPTSNGSIIPNNQMGADGSGRGVSVVVNNYTDAQAQVTERNEGGARVLEVMIRRVKDEISSEIRDGRGGVNRAMESSFNLRRNR